MVIPDPANDMHGEAYLHAWVSLLGSEWKPEDNYAILWHYSTAKINGSLSLQVPVEMQMYDSCLAPLLQLPSLREL